MKKILLLMALVLVFQAGHGVHAATYYIATTGSDFSGDGSSTNPWATINHALSKINAGDAIMVQPGTYPQSTYININDPVRHANITITGTPVDRPVIQGNPDQFSTVVIRPGVRGVTLSYLKINGGPSRKTDPSVGGVLIQVRDNPTTIQHCEIYNGYTAVSIDSSKNIDIGYNTIHTFGKINADLEDPRTWANSKGTGIGIYNYQSWGPASGWHEKIYIHHNKVFDIAEDAVLNFKAEYEYIEIAYNNFHDNYEDGIDLKTGRYYRIHHNKLHHNYGAGLVTHSGAALSYDRGADDVEFYANEVYENKNFGIFMKWGPEPATNWKIYNNLFYKNCQNPADWGVGLMLSGGGHEVYNNTFYDNTVPPTAKYPDSWCAGFWEYPSNPDVKLKNNIFYNNSPNSAGNIANTDAWSSNTYPVSPYIENNYVYPTSPGVIGTDAITVSDPGLTDPASGDFTLQSGSPLIDRGVTLALVTEDFAGTARPQGSAYDIGAYEFYPAEDTTPPETTITTGIPEFTGSSEITIDYAGTDDFSSYGSLEFSYSVDISNWSAWTTFTSVSITGLADGAHIFEVKARDEAGNEDPTPASVSFTVDTTPPAVDLNQPNPSILWPPNGEMVPVVFSGSAVDIGSGLDRLTYTMVDEYGEFGSSGVIMPESTGGFSFTLSLKADRDGNDPDDRTYTVTVTAIDMVGNTTEKTVTVKVPHKNEG